MTTALIAPADEAELASIILDAAQRGRPLAVEGLGSKRAVGRPVNASATLSLSGFAGIRSYEPEELVVVAAPATPLDELEAAFAARGQHLAFEPPDYTALLRAEHRGSLGSAIAMNLSGPGRVLHGAARDHFLGFKAVTGRGTAVKSGGKMIKNVTGFDLTKLMSGSHGTLAAFTEISVKVTPAPTAHGTLLVAGMSWEQAGRLLIDAVRSPCEVSGACYLPETVAARLDPVGTLGVAVVALRVGGTGEGIAYRLRQLERLAPGHLSRALDHDQSLALWRAIRDVAAFAAPDDERAVWRLSVPPRSGPEVASRLLVILPEAEAWLDWGGGLVWLAVPEGEDAAHHAIRAALSDGGHATLMRASEQVRAAVPVFQPLSPGAERLARGTKDSFDPRHVLNPGRMYPGF